MYLLGLVQFGLFSISSNNLLNSTSLVILPYNFDYYQIKLQEMDKKGLYGIQRYDVHNSIELKNRSLEHKYNHSVFDGYFQLYFDKTKYYDSFSKTAADCDIDFRDLFKIRFRLMFYILHLGENGLHWNGRTCDKWE